MNKIPSTKIDPLLREQVEIGLIPKIPAIIIAIEITILVIVIIIKT